MSNTFYQLATQAGGICTINGKNIFTQFNAYLKSLQVTPGDIASNAFKTVGGSSLRTSSYDMGIAGLSMVLYVGGATKEESSLNTSNIILECQDCLIKAEEEHFEYAAILSSFNVKDTEVDFYTEVELVFKAVKRLPKVTVNLSSGQGTFKNPGTALSGACITITPKVNLESIQVNGIVIMGLSSGQPFIIDGIEGTVQCNGVNRFLDTDLIDFPKVTPGLNSVVSSSNNVDIEVSFYPTFLV